MLVFDRIARIVKLCDVLLSLDQTARILKLCGVALFTGCLFVICGLAACRKLCACAWHLLCWRLCVLRACYLGSGSTPHALRYLADALHGLRLFVVFGGCGGSFVVVAVQCCLCIESSALVCA